MLRITFYQIHWFLGITAGLILSIMGVTGAIYSYDQQILKWVNSTSYIVEIHDQPKLNPTQLYQHFSIEQPNLKINSITISKDPALSSVINIEKEGERRGYNMMINPYTAEILPEIKGIEFFKFIQKLHRNLTVGPIGKQITGACTLMLFFFILSGIYLRWPKQHSIRQWLLIKPHLKGRNFIWDLHAVIGTWVVIFYLIFACTGLYWSYSWWRSGLFKIMQVEQPIHSKHQKKEHNVKTLDSLPTQSKQMLSFSQTQQILQQAWSTFHEKNVADYSSITVNIPHTFTQSVEFSFIDVKPQHERARNKLTYNHQTHQIEDIELYKDKKLNEKMMASMLPVHRGSFFGPIYQFIAMLTSLCMPLFFVTGWLLYLKRRKQKTLNNKSRRHVSNQTLSSCKSTWLIIYASQTGSSEHIAWQTALRLQEAGQLTQVKSIQKLSTEDLQEASKILFIVSTYGTGAAPDLAVRFEKNYFSTPSNLAHLRYAVLALGSKEYPKTYCHFGHRLDHWLKQSHAHSFFDIIEVNDMENSSIEHWKMSLAQAAQLHLNSINLDQQFEQWILKKQQLLNPESVGAPVYHIELESNQRAVWQAGDIVEVQPGNSPEQIKAFIKKYNLTEHSNLTTTLINTLWDKNLHTNIDSSCNIESLIQQLPILPTRKYSIASIPSQSLLCLTVRQQFNSQAELGLGSGWLTQHTHENDPITLRICNNPVFHLIQDNRPIICIGNGTGIAGLISLLYSREIKGHKENWLIFGERQRKHDFFYQDIIEAWQKNGTLKRLDLAFSRDQQSCIYVQDILKQCAEEVKIWIDNNAVIYVCGSINGMAQGVEKALIEILGENKLNELREKGHYRRDVY